MHSSDAEFVALLIIGFAWGWITKVMKDWGAEMDRQERAEKEAQQRLRRHPSWGDHE